MKSKPATLKEIARTLNISVSSASRALRNHASIGLRTKMRVQQLAKELNYQPNQNAILFKKRKTGMIGVILPFLSQDFFSAIVSGIEDIAYKSNYTLLLGQSRDDEQRERRILESMMNHRVDGLLISISKNTSSYDHLESLVKSSIPVVFFDRIPEMAGIHSIASELGKGMLEMISFLVNRKNRRIAIINGPDWLPASRERRAGYLAALKKHRIKVIPELIESSDLSPEKTREAMARLLSLKQRPTAIICFNDYVAMDAIRYAKEKKIRVNKDISFVSFANEAVCDYLDDPPLASVEQFPYRQGEKATEVLLQLLQRIEAGNPDKAFHNILLKPQLIIREAWAPKPVMP